MKKVIFFITTFLFAITAVYANEVTLVRERIGEVYTHYYDVEIRKNRYMYGYKNFFGDSTAYCIELGKLIDGNIYTYTTSFEENNINTDDLDYLKLVTYYGYDYPGHNTDKYYMGAQELIWNRMCDTSTEWVIGLMSSEVIDISKEMEDIRYLVDTHYIKPSFDNQQIELIMGEEIVLEDTNDVLSRYVTTSENVVIDGNKLIIKEGFSDDEIILTKPKNINKQFLLYTSGASQKMVSAGEVDEVTSNIKVKLIGGSIEVNKLDSETGTTPQGEATLDGAVYELFNEDGSLVDTIITGKKNVIDNLPFGVYTLKEKIPSKGYLLDTSIHTVVLTKDNLNVNIDVNENVIKRKVDIFKVFASNKTGEMTPEPGITFEVYDKNSVLISTITTDNDGYTSILLPYGTYTFRQKNTTANYYKVDDFTIEISEYDERPIYKLLSNSEITAKVKIIKKDYDTKENIIDSNIKFKIFDVDNNSYLSFKVSYPENTVTDTFQIDRNGIFITPISLSSGNYILEEVPENMNGYLYNSKKILFTIGDSSNLIEEDDEVYLEIPFYNKRVKGEINIIKYGEEVIYENNEYYYKEIPLKNVVFNLYAKEDVYENGALIYRKDELIKELMTNEEGKITESNLPLGKYYLKEIETTNNHILDETVYDIELAYVDEYTSIVTKEIEINNYLPKGTLVINKFEINTDKPIEGTLFEVCTKDRQIIYKGYTNENGQIIIENLPYGEYYLSEVEAATGYRLLEDKINIEINKDEEIINIYNEIIEVPNTGPSLSLLDVIIILVTLISIILLIFFYKDKKVLALLIIIILSGLSYFAISIYKYQSDKVSSNKGVDAYINNKIDIVTDEKYKYNAVLEVSSINLKRGILDINNEYNDAKYNVELIKEDSQVIVLAAHNGNNHNSYFGDLNKLELGDEIYYYQNGVLYKYIYTDSYDIKKNGYADIYRKDDIQSIILITCKDGTDDAQTVYIGYLQEESTY